MNDDLRHDIRFRVAFDKRSPEPNKNYGIGDMHIIFLVIGPKGAVQWLIGTGWYVDSACKHLMGFARNSLTDQRRPNGWDLGYHSKEPKYEDQSPMDQCDICEPCYYDGSSLNAELPIEGFLSGGLEYLWPKLEAFYRFTFDDGEWPFRDEAADARARGSYV